MDQTRRRQWRHVPIGWEVKWGGAWWLLYPPIYIGYSSYRWFIKDGCLSGGPVRPRDYVECRPTPHWAGERTYIHT